MNPNKVIALARDPGVKGKISQLIYHLTPLYWNYIDVIGYAVDAGQGKQSFSIHTLIHAIVTILKPNTYVEIVVFYGKSVSIMHAASPETTCYGFDIWQDGYALCDGWPIIPKGPRAAVESIHRVHPNWQPTLISGDSKATIPEFKKSMGHVDICLVDGDHRAEGARIDMDNVFPWSDIILFDDLHNPSHPDLVGVWEDVKRQNEKEFVFFEDDGYMVGCGIAFRKSMVT
jgi:hypothetical protein